MIRSRSLRFKMGRASKMYTTEDKIVDALGAVLWTGILILMMAV